MEETVVPKRPREETQVEDVACEEYSKRQKPYNHILSLLESEEEESTQDLSPLITTLQQEITCASDKDTLLMCPPQEHDQDNLTTSTTASLEDSSTSTTLYATGSDGGILKEDEGNDKERVMRHLLEASDDELGIPNSGDGFNSVDEFSSLCNGLWELEDETANYYALLQSELFL